jgi:hypothetical protein
MAGNTLSCRREHTRGREHLQKSATGSKRFQENVRPPVVGKKEESRKGAGHSPRSNGNVELSDIFESARLSARGSRGHEHHRTGRREDKRERLTASTTRGEKGGGAARREGGTGERKEMFGGSEVGRYPSSRIVQRTGSRTGGPEDRRGLEEQQRDVVVTWWLR